MSDERRVDRGDSKISLGIEEGGCPSRSTFQCNGCMRLFCSTCHAISTCDSEDIGIKTIGYWYCHSPYCVAEEARISGTSTERVEASHAKRRTAHRGNLTTVALLRQLALLGVQPKHREEAEIALDETRPRWRRLDARDYCAAVLHLDATSLSASDLLPTEHDHVVNGVAHCRKHDTLRDCADEPCWQCWHERRGDQRTETA